MTRRRNRGRVLKDAVFVPLLRVVFDIGRWKKTNCRPSLEKQFLPWHVPDSVTTLTPVSYPRFKVCLGRTKP